MDMSFEQILGDSEGLGSLACFCPWVCKVLERILATLCEEPVQFSRSVVSKSLQPHGPQPTRLPIPSPNPGVYPNSCPSSRWCHPTISSSVIPFSHLQSFPALGSFPMSQFFASEYWSFNLSISPSYEYSGLISFRIGWFDLLAVQGTHMSLPQHYSFKVLILQQSAFFMVQLSHPYMTTGKTISLATRTKWWTKCWQSDVSAF